MLRRFARFLRGRSKVFLSVAGILLAAAVGWVDFITGSEISVSLFYLIPVVLTAWFVGRWMGVAVSAQCAVEGLVAEEIALTPYSHFAVPYWNAAMMFGFYLAVTLLLVALRKSLSHEAELAREIQKNLLPGSLEISPSTTIAAAWKPSVHVGGDYFDVFPLGRDQIGFCIADASGHGMPAALLMSNVQSAVRLLANDPIVPQDLCSRLNRQAGRSFRDEDFVTLLFGILHTPTGRIVYSNAGHNPPMIIRGSGEVEVLWGGGIPLGVVESWDYPEQSVSLQPGDKIFLYTDGVTEARNLSGELFGEDRLMELLARNPSHGPEQIKNSVLEAVEDFSQGAYGDDLALLCITVNGGSEGDGLWRLAEFEEPIDCSR